MTVADLLAALRARGEPRLVDGRLRIRARRGALSPELQAEVSARKQELVEALEAEAADELVAQGRDIVAALADRGITVRLGDDGKLRAGPAGLLDGADRELLTAYREAVLAGCRRPRVISHSIESMVPDGVDSTAGASLAPGCRCLVHIEVPSSDPQVVDEIAAVLARHPGTDEVLLNVRTPSCDVTMRVGEGYRVTGGPALTADLETLFYRGVARLEAVQPQAPRSDSASEPQAMARPIVVAPAANTRVAMEPQARAGAVVVAPIASTVKAVESQAAAQSAVVTPAAGHDKPEVHRCDVGLEGLADGQSDRAGSDDGRWQSAGPVPDQPAGGLVPGIEGRLASAGAEPTGRAEPGSALRLQAAAHAAGDQPRVTAGAQTVDVARVLVTTASEWQRVMPEILAEPLLGIDTEGTGLDPFTTKLRLVQLATRYRVYLVDVFRLSLRALQPIFDRARWLVGHNLKFDFRMLMAGAIRLPADLGRRSGDTMLAGLLLEAGLPGGRYRLGDLTQRYLGIELDKTEQVSDWSGDLTEDQLAYAARDAAVLLPLKDRLQAEIERAGLAKVALIEYRALPAMAWLEQSGAPFDRAAWLALAEAAEERRRRVERELDVTAPSESPVLPLPDFEDSSRRWGSPARVLSLLESRGVALPDTRDGTLQENRAADPLIPLLLEHREAAKLCGAFGRDFLRFVHPITGRIHADYFQLGSAAGRMSCRNPNLQQMPRDPAYRACVRASEGRVLVKADYSQIELRIAAQIARDRRLIDAYERGLDVHKLTARQVLGMAEVSKNDRQAAKALNFGLIYGMGAARLRSHAMAAYSIDMSDEEAAGYRQRFFETYAGLREWHHGRPDGVVETRTLAGRRRLNVVKFTEKLNTPVQGTGADGLKLALGLLHETRDEVPSAVPVLTVHDEIVLESDVQDGERARVWLERCMHEGMAELLKRVPVEVEGQVGCDWSMTADPSERTEAA